MLTYSQRGEDEPEPLSDKNERRKNMNVYLNSEFIAKPDDYVLGYVGEHNTRRVVFNALRLDGADSYSCLIEYTDGVKYEVPVENSYFTVTASMLRYPQTVKCQVLAKASISGTDAYRLVKKSNIFELEIAPSIDGDPQPVPTYEQTLSLLDRLSELVNNGTLSENLAEMIRKTFVGAIEEDLATA